MGMRQLYLRGREHRRRYIEDKDFLSPDYDPAELETFSSDEGRV
jgi:hypothetical protein